MFERIKAKVEELQHEIDELERPLAAIEKAQPLVVSELEAARVLADAASMYADARGACEVVFENDTLSWLENIQVKRGNMLLALSKYQRVRYAAAHAKVA